MNATRSQSDQSGARRQGGLSARVGMLCMLSSSLILSLPQTTATAENHEKKNHSRERSEKEKIRVAVLDFGTESLSPEWRFSWASSNVGSLVASNLTTQLAKKGAFDVIERQRVEKVLGEQDFAASGRVDQATAARIGRILGAQVVIFGDVTEFSVKEHHGSGWLPGVKIPLPGVLKKGGPVAASVTTVKTKLSARLVDACSARILDVAEGKGSEHAGEASAGYLQGGKQFDPSQISGLLDEAVKDLAKNTAETADDIHPSSCRTCIAGLVANVEGGMVYLNVGKSAGVEAGDHFEIRAVDKVIRDPNTGEELGKKTARIGLVRVEAVHGEKLSETRVVEGTGFQAKHEAMQVGAPGAKFECLPPETGSARPIAQPPASAAPAADTPAANGHAGTTAATSAPAASSSSAPEGALPPPISAPSDNVVGSWVIDMDETPFYWFKKLMGGSVPTFMGVGMGAREIEESFRKDDEFKRRTRSELQALKLQLDLRVDKSFSLRMINPADNGLTTVDGEWSEEGLHVILAGKKVDGREQKEPAKVNFRRANKKLFGQGSDKQSQESGARAGRQADDDDRFASLLWPYMDALVLTPAKAR